MSMNGKDDFANVQRRNSAVMAKYEWTSSLMSMQKSGNEIHDRRNKNHRKANEFLQGLLQKRSDGSLLDDNGTLDRYQKFLKYKSNGNDDGVLNEFDRRLRALNRDRRNQLTKNIPLNNKKSMTTIDSQVFQETESDDVQPIKPTDRIKSLSKSTITSNNSLLSSITSENNHTDIRSPTDEFLSTSSSERSNIKMIHRPKVQRADGTEITVTSTRRTLRRASSDILIFNHCHFPRSLKSRQPMNNSVISEKHASPLPSIAQHDNTQLFHLLDQIENECSHANFATMLDELIVSSVQTQQIETNIPDISEDEKENGEDVLIHSNLFDQADVSSEYYTTFNINIDNPKKVFVYTMTIGIVQLTPSLTVPYSILNGRRPLLQSSVQTNFQKVHSKRPKHSSQVTAIESLTNMESLRENDIILKINDQSVQHLTTEAVRDMLQQSNDCLLTVARLCQPFI